MVLLTGLFSVVVWAQGVDALSQLKADPRKSYGNDYPYPLKKVELTKAPKEYTPFYISHYARHGSRYYWSDKLYPELDTRYRNLLLTKSVWACVIEKFVLPLHIGTYLFL